MIATVPRTASTPSFVNAAPPRRPDDAEALHRSTYSLALGQLGAGHPLTLLARSNLVEALVGRSMAGTGRAQGQGQADAEAAEEQATGAEAEEAAAGQAAGDSPAARAAREEARQLLQVREGWVGNKVLVTRVGDYDRSSVRNTVRGRPTAIAVRLLLQLPEHALASWGAVARHPKSVNPRGQ